MQASDGEGQDDWELAELAKCGHESAFAELVARHQDPIHRFIFRDIGDDGIARDLTQEVFVQAYFALDRLQKKAKFTTWLFQIAVNKSLDYAKSKKARQDRVTITDSEKSRTERESSLTPAQPDRQAELSETLAVLEEEIRRLPHELRQPLVLGTIEGYSHKEVAGILGISPKAVEVRIYRARKCLIERLGVRDIDVF